MRMRRPWRFSVAKAVLLAWLVLLLINVVWPVPAEVAVVGVAVSVIVIAAAAVTDRNVQA